MKYGRLTLQYIKTNFLMLLSFTVIPAVIMAFSASPSSIVKFFINYKANLENVWSVHRYFTLLGGQSWTMGLLAVPIVCFFLSLCYGAIDRHLKIGRISIKKSFTSLNETVLVVVPTFVLFTIGFEFVAFLNASVITLFHLAFPVVSIVFAVVSTLILYVAFMLTVVYFSLVVPSVLVVGYPFKDGCIYSTKLMSGRVIRVFKDVVKICLTVMIISALVNVLFPVGWLCIVIDSILNVAILQIVLVYPMVTFFDITEEPRSDLDKFSKKYLT